MGNAAGKQVESAELGKVTHHVKGENAIDAELVATKATECVQKGNKLYYKDYDEPCLKITSEGLWGKKGTLRNSDDKEIGKVALKGFVTETTCIYRGWPSYKDQKALTAEELKKMKEPGDAKMHLFAKIETKMGLSTATATYSIVSGVDDKDEPLFKPLYVAEKLSAMKFIAVVRTAEDEGVAAAKAVQQGGLSTDYDVEIAEGADMAAILALLIAITPGGNVGGLVGAGVI